MFFFRKKSESETQKKSCLCQGSQRKCEDNNAEHPRFIVLGACCKKSEEAYQNTKLAVESLGLSDQVINIGDPVEIAKYGVMQTPALIIDGKLVSSGKALSVDAVRTLIKNQALGV